MSVVAKKVLVSLSLLSYLCIENSKKTEEMKNTFIMAMLLLFCACSKDAEAEPQAPVTPETGEETVSTICKTLVNPNATTEAQTLYTRLLSV